MKKRDKGEECGRRRLLTKGKGGESKNVVLKKGLNFVWGGGNTVKPWRNLNYDYFMQNRI